MLFNQIKHCQLKELATQKLTLLHLYILEQAIRGYQISGYKDKKLLESRGLVSGDKITEYGEVLYNKVINAQEVLQKVKLKSITPDTQYDIPWSEFWATFPSSAAFIYKGHQFKSERVLRGSQQECKQKYIKLLTEDKISPETLLKCLKTEIATRKEESFNNWRKENKLHYMNGCLPWLNQRIYQGYLEREMPENKEQTIYTEA